MTTRNWTNAAGGTWSVASNWSGGVVPGPADEAVISQPPAAGAYTITIAAPVAVAGVQLDQAQATLDLAGTSLSASVALQAGTLALGAYDAATQMEQAGILSGTVTQGAGILFVAAAPKNMYGQPQASIGGTLSGVTWQGVLAPVFDPMGQGYGTLLVAGGLKLAGANGSGAGSLVLDNTGTLDFAGTTVLDDANVSFDGGIIASTRTGSTAATLTLGSGLTLSGTGGSLVSNDTIVNDGTIEASGGLYIPGETNEFSEYPGGAFVNNGGIVLDGGYSTVNVRSFSGTGSITLNNGASLDMTNFDPTATEVVDGGTIAVNAGHFQFGYDSNDGPIVLENTTLTLGALGAASFVTTSEATIAASTIVVQSGSAVQIYDDDDYGYALTNDGTITGAVAGGSLVISNSYDATLTNDGVVAISNGDTVQFGAYDNTGLNGTGSLVVTNATAVFYELDTTILQMLHASNATIDVLQTLNAIGATLRLGKGVANTILQLGGPPAYAGAPGVVMSGGTIIDGGGGVHFVGDVTLSDVVYRGKIVVDRPYTSLTLDEGVQTGRSGSGLGSISLTGAQSSLSYSIGYSAIADDTTLNIGNAVALQPDQPRFYAGNTTLGAHYSIVQAGAYAAIGAGIGTGNITGTCIDSGSITAAIAGGEITIDGMGFTNAGTIAVSNHDTLVSASETFANTGLITLAASALELDLTNYFESFTIAAQSFTNAGSIALAGGSISELTENGLYPAVPLLNTGTISGSGSIAVQIVNDGRIEASQGALALNKAVTGAGTLQVDGTAQLTLGSVAASQTALFSGIGGVLALTPMSFLGTIGGFAAGDTLDLHSTAATAASFSGSTILITLASGGTESLHIVAPLTGHLLVTPGAQNDTLVTFASAAHPAEPVIFDAGLWHAVLPV